MVREGIFLCSVIMAMDMAGGILSITAEVADKCNQSRHASIVLGIIAAILTALAHLLANLFACLHSSYMERLEQSPSTRRLIFISIIFSWFIVAIGLSVLIIGSIANIKSKSLCGMARHHMLIGGICCIVHALIACIWCYIFTLVTHQSEKCQVNKGNTL